MAHLTKKALLAQIRERLYSQSVESSGTDLYSRETAIQQTADTVMRENGLAAGDYLDVRPKRVTKSGMTQTEGGELREIFDTLTSTGPGIVAGNRVSRATFLASRTVKANGQDTIGDDAQITFEKRSYSVPTHSAHPTRRKSEPKWSRSELDMELTLRGLALYFQDHPRTVVKPKPLTIARLRRGFHVPISDAPFAVSDGRTVRGIARSRHDVYENAHDAQVLADYLAGQRGESRRENPPRIIHPAVPRPNFPGAFGFARPAYRPHAKWFQINPPILAPRSATA